MTILPIVGYFICCIPYYRMAKNAGIANPWLALFPVTKNYIMLGLSNREFSIFKKLHLKDRSVIYWIRLISFFGIFIAYTVLFGVYTHINLGILMIFKEQMEGEITVPGLGTVFQVIAGIITLIYLLFIVITNWRIYYDILVTYGMQKHAMWASILNILCPVIMVVFSFIIMNKEPKRTIIAEEETTCNH